MKIINLLPKANQNELKLELISQQLLNFWVWVIGTLLVLFVLSLLTATQLNRTVDQTEVQIAANKEQLKSAANQQLEKQVINLNSEISRIRNLRSQHYRWSNGLIELANLTAPDMVIDLLELDRATGEVKIIGSSQSRSSVLAFWGNMHRSKYFKDINFPLSNLERASNTEFNFTFYINEDRIKEE